MAQVNCASTLAIGQVASASKYLFSPNITQVAGTGSKLLFGELYFVLPDHP